MSVFWITGLSGAGKTTLAREIITRMRLERKPVISLDGDELRRVLGCNPTDAANFSREGRLALAFQYARLCQLIARQNVDIVIATISMFKEIYVWNRAHIPGYVEIYLKVPLHELSRRDTKGIYNRHDSGEVVNVAGVDLLIDEPPAADFVFEFVPGRSALELADEVFSKLNKTSSAYEN